MKYAYVAIDPKTNDCYGICSIGEHVSVNDFDDIKRWEHDGAIIKFLPYKEAMKLFDASLNNKG